VLGFLKIHNHLKTSSVLLGFVDRKFSQSKQSVTFSQKKLFITMTSQSSTQQQQIKVLPAQSEQSKKDVDSVPASHKREKGNAGSRARALRAAQHEKNSEADSRRGGSLHPPHKGFLNSLPDVICPPPPNPNSITDQQKKP
jgi:hypothetical protein